ncbi:hypothetical protein, conserved [Entamoeba dispar SAW760]|uniref:DSBA-like thioredoxin domain-containing protein n=1 Tax=Entamoeba dispar (strain ATCC PRA-260 / SAW760) TaxID=370354 RepID=B0EGD4_ENTDS|nr:uncharacterized protein EDI_226260 [Entamoeba dispar SAW760]EDR26410.1 hypothetical protein, conserved [Entamoeba dispar SAW760]|eukprot:EDR26410.1 hypothetical protein, conserved [Entamoeba dispar SAW760]
MERIHITIISDISCPWCYVGRKRMLNAISTIKNKEISYEYHPYIIDMKTKKDGEEYMAYNVRRWGGDGWTYSMIRDSKADGCNFAQWKYWPYSLHCHRLMIYANTIGKGNELMGIYFQMNYEEGKNLSIQSGLMEAAERCGLDLTIAKRIITSDENKDIVMRELHNWHSMGISGVPFFIIEFGNGKQVTLSGAVSSSKWLSVIQKYSSN